MSALLTMVQTHLTITWTSGIPTQQWVKWPPLISLRGSEETPTITLWLQRVDPNVWSCRGGFKQVQITYVFGVCQDRNGGNCYIIDLWPQDYATRPVYELLRPSLCAVAKHYIFLGTRSYFKVEAMQPREVVTYVNIGQHASAMWK